MPLRDAAGWRLARLAGEAAGSKLTKAQALGVPIIDEAALRALVAAMRGAQELFAAVEKNPEAVTAVFRGIMNAIIGIVKVVIWLTETWATMRDAWNRDAGGMRSIIQGVGSALEGVIGGVIAVGSVTGRDYLKKPGLHRTLLGAAGITLEYPIMRHANNLESVLTYEGTSEVHQLVIGQALTGASAFR